MKLKCPACGALSSLDVLIASEGAREAVMLALRAPAPLGKRLIQYLALFRPLKRELSFERVASLLNELLPDIERAQVQRNGRDWSAPQVVWVTAIEVVLAARDAGKLQLPLKTHGYLYEVIASQTNQFEAKAETAREYRRQQGEGWRQGCGFIPAADALTRDSPPLSKARRAPMPAFVKQTLNKTAS